MTALDTTRTAGSVALSGGRISRFLTATLAAIAAWNDARITRNALSRLSDRELDDIGLCRADIDTIVATGR
ncbi:MAG: DUF1127 domain-containing protein [Gemmobacter sp.]